MNILKTVKLIGLLLFVNISYSQKIGDSYEETLDKFEESGYQFTTSQSNGFLVISQKYFKFSAGIGRYEITKSWLFDSTSNYSLKAFASTMTKDAFNEVFKQLNRDHKSSGDLIWINEKEELKYEIILDNDKLTILTESL
jgi:hypothetical protein